MIVFRSSVSTLGILIIAGVSFLACGTEDSPQNQELHERKQISIPAATSQAWALATTAILTERNNQRHDLLGGSELTQVEITRWKRVLSEWWGIRNKQDLLKALEWIDRGGHRKDFEKLGAYVASLDDKQLEEAWVKAGQDEQSKHELNIVRNYYGKFSRKSLLAWDYGRYISLCRWGYLVGYLTEEEAWDRVMPPAIRLQKTFESWKDLGENYLVGREFWSYEQTKKDGQLYREAYQYLLDASDSPWNLNPWEMPLGLSNH